MAAFDLRIRCRTIELRPVTESDLPLLASMQPADYEHDPRAEMLPRLDPAQNRRRLVYQDYWRAMGARLPLGDLPPRRRRELVEPGRGGPSRQSHRTTSANTATSGRCRVPLTVPSCDLDGPDPAGDFSANRLRPAFERPNGKSHR